MNYVIGHLFRWRRYHIIPWWPVQQNGGYTEHVCASYIFFILLPVITILFLSPSVKLFFFIASSNMIAAGFCLPTISEMVHVFKTIFQTVFPINIFKGLGLPIGHQRNGITGFIEILKLQLRPLLFQHGLQFHLHSDFSWFINYCVTTVYENN